MAHRMPMVRCLSLGRKNMMEDTSGMVEGRWPSTWGSEVGALLSCRRLLALDRQPGHFRCHLRGLGRLPRAYWVKRRSRTGEQCSGCGNAISIDKLHTETEKKALGPPDEEDRRHHRHGTGRCPRHIDHRPGSHHNYSRRDNSATAESRVLTLLDHYSNSPAWKAQYKVALAVQTGEIAKTNADLSRNN